MDRKEKGTRGWVGRLQELYAVVEQEPFLASEEWSLILVNFYIEQTNTTISYSARIETREDNITRTNAWRSAKSILDSAVHQELSGYETGSHDDPRSKTRKESSEPSFFGERCEAVHHAAFGTMPSVYLGQEGIGRL